MTKTKEKPVCPYCGSDNVAFDAAAVWDIEIGEYSITTIFDNCTCQDCDTDTNNPNWVKVEEG